MILLLFLLIGMLKNGKCRYDGSPSLPYYSAEELGIKEEKFSSYSGKFRLNGSRYYEKDGRFKGVIVFFHGIGAGRSAYLKLISIFAKAGYLVYAYDNTGCMESEGQGYIGLGRVNYDQEAFFFFLNQDPKAKGYRRYVVGHSWGGYGALIACKKKYRVEKAVSIAGFLRPSEEILFVMKKSQKGILPFLVSAALRLSTGKNGDLDAKEVIKDSDARILYIQGENDSLVPFKNNGNLLKEKFRDEKKIRFLFLKGRGHSPYLSKNAEDYSFSFIEDVAKTIEQENHPSLDIERACELESKVIQAIIDFLNE